MANEFKVKNGLIVSGSAEIEQNLRVKGRLTVDELHTSITSSSILYESGSTKFGNDLEDNHEFTGSVNITGSISLNGEPLGTGKLDETTFYSFTSSYVSSSASFNTRITDLESFSSSLDNNFVSETEFGSYTSSAKTRLELIETSTGSLNSYTTSNEIKLGVIESTTSSLNSYTASANSKFGIIESTTGSLNSYTASADSRLNSLSTTTDNLNIFTSSVSGKLTSIEIATSSLNSFTTSINGKLSTIENTTSSLNTFTSSINTTIKNKLNSDGVISGSSQILNNSNIVSSSAQVTTYGFATTGSNLFIGTQTHSGSILPSVDNLYDLGSPEYQWRDVYISSGSLYIDGTKVISSTAQELVITTDNGQSIKILEGTTDSIILQTADGDIELKSSGDGDILLDPTNGKIMLKGPIEILNGQKIQSSVGGTPVVFANDIVVSGSIDITGTIEGIDLTVFSSSVNTRLTNLENSGGSLNSFTASAISRLNSLESTTGSLNTYTSSNNVKLNSIEVVTSSLNTFTSSTNGRLNSIDLTTSSLNTFTSSTNSRLNSIETSTSSLNSYTTSANTKFSGIENVTSSFASYSGTTNTRLNAIETSTGSLNSFTSSINTTIKNRLNIENVISGSVQVILTGATGFSTFSSSLATTDAGQDGRLTSLENKTGSYATTGSNIFIGNQTITGSLFISQDLIIGGSSSIQHISSSVVNIADNIITVNAQNPSIRFGGLAVIDSGSSPQVSGSMLFDSVNDQWIFVHQNQAMVTSSILLMGPQTFNNLGNETFPSTNRVLKSLNAEHVGDSNITDTGTKVSVNSTTEITGSLTTTGNLISNANLVSNFSAGDEGGEISLNKPVTNTTINGVITIDVWRDNVRIFENGGTNRGGFFNIANLSAGVGTNLNVTSNISAIESTTASLNSYTSSNTTNINAIHTATASLNSHTSSANTRLNTIESTTSSLNTFTSSANSRLSSLETTSGSIRNDFNSYTSSANGRLSSIESSTGSLNSHTSSTNTRLNSIETATGSLNSFTGSINTTIKNRLNAENVISGSSQLSSAFLPLSGGTMSGAIVMSGTQQIRLGGFSGIEYYNTGSQWQGYIGTENNTGNLRYNSFNGTHTWYSNSTQTMTLNSSGTLTTEGNIYISNNGGRLYFDRPNGATVGAIGWHTDDIFYVAGHPDYGPGAGNSVRVYGFGSNLHLGNSTNGDVITINGTTGAISITRATTLTSDLRFNQGSGFGRVAYLDNYHGMILRGIPSDALGNVTVGDFTSLIQHSGDFRFYRTNGTINELYFQVNASGLNWRGNTIWHAGNFTPGNYLPLSGGTMSGGLTIGGGADLVLRAPSGSDDSGDIVFQNGSGSEIHRLWAGSNTLNYRTNAGTTFQLWHTGNLTNLSQLTNGPGYLTSIIAHNQAWSTITSTPTTLAGYGISDGVFTATSSFTTAGTGWYRVATTAGDGRGYYYVEVFTTGGNHNPSYLRIEAMGDWGNDKLIAAYTDQGFPASAVRITRTATTTFLEVNFTTTILGANMRVVRLGFDSGVSVLSGALSAGGGTIQETLSVTAKINAASISVAGNSVWHSGNFNPGSYLPLSGGAMSGAISYSTGTAINHTGTGQISIARHTGGGTPVPFVISESSTSNNNDASYGTLHIDRSNLTANGAGANLHFTILGTEYGGMGVTAEAGVSSGSATGTMRWYLSSGGTTRIQRMTLDSSGNLNTVGAITSTGANINGVWTTTISTSGGWNKLSFVASGAWGDGVTYGVLGAGGGAEPGVMTYNQHATWVSNENGAGIRMGRSGGVSSGAWYQVATMASNEFMIAMNGSWSNGGLKITSDGVLRYGNTGNRYVWENATWAINITGTLSNGFFNINGNGYSTADADQWPHVFWLRDTNNNWDEGLIKNSSSRGFFSRAGWGIHMHSTRAFHFFSSGWDSLMGIEGGTGNVRTKNNLTVGGTLTENSSIRYKKEIETLKYGINEITQMRGVSYIKKQTNQKEIGVIAEEIAEILPELVNYDTEGKPDSVSYGRITAVLIEAIKELKSEIDFLKQNK